MRYISLICLGLLLTTGAVAQNIMNNPGSNHGNRFEQLGTILPTPNEYRTASGAPGPKYWQQRADYDIKCELDEKNLKLIGTETVTYFNNSPDVLTYIWLQLDENEHNNLQNANYPSSSQMPRGIQESNLEAMANTKAGIDNGFGVKIAKLTDVLGKPMKYTINKTMMRIDLATPLKPGQKVIFNIDWSYKISDRMSEGGRGGYEFFPEDGNHLFTMAQWFPRLCVYSDFQGWQNHQFTGTGEFALAFGNYKVQITVPADHVVAATGECLNYAQILSPAQMQRWNQAQNSKDVVEIVTLDEAKKAEAAKSTAKKTWVFKADNVRDFAWGSSRKFIWDAMPAYVEGKKIMCMSQYPKEAYGLWRKYSTKVVAHTIKSYSKFSIPYPYPVAQSVEAANGMEYPMICFNNGRTNRDGTYSEGTKYAMIGVIVHEVGHNFFPMIVNSDERQWTWMDEGINSFVQYLAEELWDNKYPSRGGGPAANITSYMGLPKDNLEPIMTNSENIRNFGANAYSKPATGMNILRETIMGRELFDFAFREYARRWAFKHPTPADLFRTMEDASGEDLDWFWRGWFYGIEPCDIAIDTVKVAAIDMNAVATTPTPGSPSKVSLAKSASDNLFDDISKQRNRADKSIVFAVDADTTLRDFYWRYARGIEPYDTARYTNPPNNFPQPVAAGEDVKNKWAGTYMYEITFSNKGGLVMPVIVEFTFEDGTKEINRTSVQIWRKNENRCTKVFMTSKKVKSIKLDPMKETADINEGNNNWGKFDAEPSKFTVFKNSLNTAGSGYRNSVNPMQASQMKKN